MIEAAKNKFGRLDYAFNNAGIAGSKADAVHELPLEVCSAPVHQLCVNLGLRPVHASAIRTAPCGTLMMSK